MKNDAQQRNTLSEKFRQIELSLNLKKQLYDAKFVYSQQQNSNNDAFLIKLSKQLPSQLHGFTYQDIHVIHALASQMLSEAAKSLNVPVCTLIFSQCLFHFFYARKSYLEYDIRDIMMGCMYLACKSEQTLRKSYQITIVFDYIFKVYEGDKRINAMTINSPQYQHMKNTTIMKSQLDILFQLGFQTYRLFDIPHRYLNSILILFQKHPKYTKICQQSWKTLNTLYTTIICLYFPHNVIATSSIYIAMRQNNIQFPEVPWWTLLECYEEQLQFVYCFMKQVLEVCQNKQRYLYVCKRINEIGEINQLINTFPTPYYTKIKLQKKGQFRVSKYYQQNIQHYIPSVNNKVINLDQQIFNKDRKIVRVKYPEEQQQENIKSQLHNQQKKAYDQESKPKISIDKASLLANINKKLIKHEANLIKKSEQIQSQNVAQYKKAEQPKKSSDSSSSSSSQQQAQKQMIAQLRKLRKMKKQAEIINKQ